MQDEMPSPYPVWPAMGFDEWMAKQEYELAAILHNEIHDQILAAWAEAFGS